MSEASPPAVEGRGEGPGEGLVEAPATRPPPDDPAAEPTAGLTAARAPHPFEAAGLRAWWASVGQRPFTVADGVIVAALLYVVITTIMRLAYSFHPWAMEGDWKQWIWQYHRYWTDGAFPPGHVITDYQFRVQPPFYFVVMAGLSHLMHPGVAARLLGLVAFAATLAGTYHATRKLSHWLMGLAACVVLMHSDDLFRSTMGGYPRSFGPPLVLLLLDAWLARRHGRALLLLVLMAGIYPSVLPPAGLAYGGWTVLAATREGARAFVVKTGSLVVTAVVAAGLGLMQNLLALPWWGPVIGLAEAQELAALQPGGRMKWLPLGDYVGNLWVWLFEPWNTAGALKHFGLLPWGSAVPHAVGGALLLVLLVVVLARRALAGRTDRTDRTGRVVVRVPWEVLVLVASSALTYWVARELAFRLYLPHRVIQHTLPYCTIVLGPALAYQALAGLPRLRRQVSALSLALVLSWAPLFAFAGDGFIFLGWGIYSHRVSLMRFFRDETPVTAQVAGDLAIVDIVPYFAARPVYVNWTMAHPFRVGYWREMERRLLRMHEAMYASDRVHVLRFLYEEKIDYLAIDPRRFDNPDTGRKLFHPLREPVLALWKANRARGFALAAPPASAVVWSDPTTIVLDARKLMEAWAPVSSSP